MLANFMAIAESKSSGTEFAICACCGMTEEYAAAYIESVQDLYVGKLICGLCSEAVKYEILQRRIDFDEALAIHVRFCGEFVASPSPRVDFISAIGEMFRRRILDLPLPPPSLERTQPVDAGGICAAAVIGGTGSCLAALSGGA